MGIFKAFRQGSCWPGEHNKYLPWFLLPHWLVIGQHGRVASWLQMYVFITTPDWRETKKKSRLRGTMKTNFPLPRWKPQGSYGANHTRQTNFRSNLGRLLLAVHEGSRKHKQQTKIVASEICSKPLLAYFLFLDASFLAFVPFSRPHYEIPIFRIRGRYRVDMQRHKPRYISEDAAYVDGDVDTIFFKKKLKKKKKKVEKHSSRWGVLCK